MSTKDAACEARPQGLTGGGPGAGSPAADPRSQGPPARAARAGGTAPDVPA